MALAAVGGKVHVLGGSVLGITGPYHQEYDPPTDTWRARAPLPTGLDHIGAAVLNGKIYTIGGFVGGGASRWAKRAPTSMTRPPTPGASWRR